MADDPRKRSRLPDDEAIEAMAAVDRQQALGMVVQRHRARLVRHAASILKDRERAHDAVQDVFIKAMREKRFFDAGFKRGAWLHRVTNNLCLNMVRDRRRRGDILANMDTPKSAAPRQEATVTHAERADRMREALSRLSEPHRRILQERFFSDLSYNEIAEVLDLKLGTVMSRLSRAKSALSAVLDGEPVSEWS